MIALGGIDPRELVARGVASGLIKPYSPPQKLPRVAKEPPIWPMVRRERHRRYMAQWRERNQAWIKEQARLKGKQNLAAGLRWDGKPRVRAPYRPRGAKP